MRRGGCASSRVASSSASMRWPTGGWRSTRCTGPPDPHPSGIESACSASPTRTSSQPPLTRRPGSGIRDPGSSLVQAAIAARQELEEIRFGRPDLVELLTAVAPEQPDRHTVGSAGQHAPQSAGVRPALEYRHGIGHRPILRP